MHFERSNIQAMRGYTPGEQPQQADIIKLNTNENPYPASDAVGAALAGVGIEELRRYPPPLANEFRLTAAQYHQLDKDNILPTNGGDELLRLAVTTFAAPGDTIAIAKPSYSLYPVLTEIHDCKLAEIPLTSNWNLPDDFCEALQHTDAKLAMLVNPHAPSGLLTDAGVLIDIAKNFNGVLLVDEAYVDFVDPAHKYDLVASILSLDNLLILRTLSKGYSLAGLRFGYGIGAKSLLEPMLYKTRDSYNTDFISQKLATAALSSTDDAKESWIKVRAERQKLAIALNQLGLPCLPSQANFLLAQASTDKEANDIYTFLKNQGILIRYFNEEGLKDKLRISIGTATQNELLLSNLQKFFQLK